MTVVIGYREEATGRCYVAADRAVTNSSDITCLACPKVWIDGPFLMGASGELVFLQIARYSFSAPEYRQTEQGTRDAYMVRVFVPALWKACEQAGNLRAAEKDGPLQMGGSLLVCVEGLIYVVNASGAVVRTAGHYAAIGSGEFNAMGALGMLDQLPFYTLPGQKMPAFPVRSILEAVLTVCESQDNCVRRPFDILPADA